MKRNKATALSILAVLALVFAPIAPAFAGGPRHWTGGYHGPHLFGLGGAAVGAVVGLLTLPLAIAAAVSSYDEPRYEQDYGPPAYPSPPPAYYAPPAPTYYAAPPPAYYGPAPAYYAPPAYYAAPVARYRPAPRYYAPSAGYADRPGYAARPRYNEYSGYRAAPRSGYYHDRR